MRWPKPERTIFHQPVSEVTITRGGVYPFVEVKLNGRAFRFALETGGSFFGISERAAAALGLERRATGNPAGQGPAAIAKIDSVQLGGVSFYNVDAAFSELFATRDFDGIVSPPLLRDVLYTIDLRNNRLRLERGALPAADGRTIFPIAGKDRGSRVDVTLDLGGAKVDGVIDTQSLFEVMIADSLESSLLLSAAPRSLGTALGPSQGTFTIRGARLRGEARMGSLTIAELPIAFRNRPGAVLGIPFLEPFAVTIDNANGRVRFTPHDTPVRFTAASFDRPMQRGGPGAPAQPTSAATPASSSQEGIRAEITRLNQSMMAAWERNDALAIAAHYSDDARIIGPGGSVVEGRDAVNRYWTGFPTQGRTWTLEVIEAGGSRDLAYQWGRSSIVGPQRSQTVNFVGVWKRQPNGELKLAVDYYVPAR
ncbi:MAG: aspartyl protease family protein [Gemmatimonadota bacterium]